MGPGAKVAVNSVAGVVGILGIFFLLCLGCLVPLDFIFALVAGWILYLVRVVPQITWNWSGLLTALACLAALAFGLQSFLRWLYKQLQVKSGNEALRDWSWSWTLRILGLVVLMFVAGISAVGVTHQTAWLVTSPGPLLDRGSFRQAVNRTQSTNNLKQIGLACHNYHDSFAHFPAGATFDAEGHMLHGWQTQLLPFLEQDDLYRRINQKVPWADPDNAPALRQRVAAYLNPAVEEQQDKNEFFLSHYAGNARVLGGDVGWKMKDITDGLSNTLLAGEVAGNFKPWGHPANWRDPALGINSTPDGFGAPWQTTKGANFSFADGSVRFIKEDIDPVTLKALSTPNGGESVELDDY
jgi:prepilin-type processing-associated H-X9-DG protein